MADRKQAWDNDGTIRDDTRRCKADIAILAFHDGWELHEGWSFYVLHSAVVNDSKSTITRSELERLGVTAVTGTRLADAVRSTWQVGSGGRTEAR